jgi:two-component system, chemotaxis family, chemotaxis protein CheY
MNVSDLRVLVVDDFPAMRKLVVKGLRQMGVTAILEAGDGIDALKLMELNRVDLLVSDWNMPDMGGLELLRWVRKNFTQARLPFLMITSKGQQIDVVQAVKAGVDAYIIKPFTQEGLEAKVAKLLPQAAEFAAARAAAEAAAAAQRDEASRLASADLGAESEALKENVGLAQTEVPPAAGAANEAPGDAAAAEKDSPAEAQAPRPSKEEGP